MNLFWSMRYVFGLALLCIAAIGELTAQNIYVSDEIKMRRDRSYDLLGKVGDHIVIAEYDFSRVNLTFMDESMKVKKNVEKYFEGRTTVVESMLITEDNIHAFYTTRDRNIMFLLNKVMSSTGEDIRVDTIGAYELKFFKPEIRYSQSEDLSKLGIVLRQNNNIESVFVYDMVYGKRLLSEPFFLEETANENIYIKSTTTNDGHLYIVTESHNNRGRLDQHALDVFVLNATEGNVLQQKAPIPEFMIFDMQVYYDNRIDILTVGGLYGDRSQNAADGLFYFDFDFNAENEQKIFRLPFTDQFLRSYHNKNASGRRSAFDLSFQQIVKRQDGGFMLFFEEVAHFSRAFSGNRFRVPANDFLYYSTDHHYEDLYIFSMNAQGDLEWETTVPKNQFSSDDEGAFSSFFLFENSNHLRVLYNDEVKRNNTLSEVILLSNGYSRRNTLLSVPVKDFLIQLSQGIQISEREAIFPSFERGELKITKFEFLN